MIKAKAWNGKALPGEWEITYKIDGVRALWTSEGWLSRANKPLYNVPTPVLTQFRDAKPPRWMPGSDCEVYLGNFRDTIRAVRTKKLKPDTPVIWPEHLFSLDPLDARLKAGTCKDLTPACIKATMKAAVRLGYEGLVLRQGDKWLKVKPEETHDVLVTGAVGGVGKHKGRLGALQTAKGDVGTGFTDKEREFFWAAHMSAGVVAGFASEPLIGRTIEVSCMHFTPDGKFRHPRFVRMRPDKVANA